MNVGIAVFYGLLGGSRIPVGLSIAVGFEIFLDIGHGTLLIVAVVR